MDQFIEAQRKLNADLRKAATTLTDDEARFLVTNYYNMQDQRKRANAQVFALNKTEDPHEVIDWYAEQSGGLERGVLGAIKVYAEGKILGRWAMSICGVGPVIAAGLLAHIDVTKPTVGHIWRFAGLDPTSTWEKKTKRPWNAALKELCWKIGESFVKVQPHDADVYGKVYAKRKLLEAGKNENGDYANQAAEGAKRVNKSTKAFKSYDIGLLPDGHLHARAKRYAVKLFLAHYHAVGFYMALKRLPPRPWIIEQGGHSHIIAPPNMEAVDGMAAEWRKQNGAI